METFAFFFAAGNQPFFVATVVLLVIAGLEVVSLVLGLGLSELIDSWLPDFDADLDADVDVDMADTDVSVPHTDAGLFTELWGWINVGRVPFLVWLIAFLSAFAMAGYGLQLAAASVFALLPAAVAGTAAFAAAVPTTRAVSRMVAHLLPREESYVVGSEDFVGLTAAITLGPVDRETPGKARLVDRHGNRHFVRIRAAGHGDRFEIDDTVLLVGRDGAIFEAIRPPETLD